MSDSGWQPKRGGAPSEPPPHGPGSPKPPNNGKSEVKLTPQETIQLLFERACEFHAEHGGSCGRLSGHAIRFLCEAVELCVASGAYPGEITTAVKAEIQKAIDRDEFKGVDLEKVGEEYADTRFCLEFFRHYAGITPELEEAELLAKWKICEARKWEADADGVLHRPREV